MTGLGAVLACAVLVAVAVLAARPDPGPGRRRVLARPHPVGERGDRAVRALSEPSAWLPLTAADVAVLADQLAALAAAGLPPHRIWAAVADHGPTASLRSAAAEVVVARSLGLSPAEALRTRLSPLSGRGRSPLSGRGRSSRFGRGRSSRSGRGRSSRSGRGRSSRFRRGRSSRFGRGRSSRFRRGRGRGGDAAAALQLAVALDVSERAGAGAAPTLQRFAEALRADERAAQERASALAGPQATAAVLSVLPLAGLLLGAAVGGRPWHALLVTTPGRWCLVLGGALWAMGRWWTKLLVRRAASTS